MTREEKRLRGSSVEGLKSITSGYGLSWSACSFPDSKMMSSSSSVGGLRGRAIVPGDGRVRFQFTSNGLVECPNPAPKKRGYMDFEERHIREIVDLKSPKRVRIGFAFAQGSPEAKPVTASHGGTTVVPNMPRDAKYGHSSGKKLVNETGEQKQVEGNDDGQRIKLREQVNAKRPDERCLHPQDDKRFLRTPPRYLCDETPLLQSPPSSVQHRASCTPNNPWYKVSPKVNTPQLVFSSFLREQHGATGTVAMTPISPSIATGVIPTPTGGALSVGLSRNDKSGGAGSEASRSKVDRQSSSLVSLAAAAAARSMTSIQEEYSESGMSSGYECRPVSSSSASTNETPQKTNMTHPLPTFPSKMPKKHKTESKNSPEKRDDSGAQFRIPPIRPRAERSTLTPAAQAAAAKAAAAAVSKLHENRTSTWGVNSFPPPFLNTDGAMASVSFDSGGGDGAAGCKNQNDCPTLHRADSHSTGGPERMTIHSPIKPPRLLSEVGTS